MSSKPGYISDKYKLLNMSNPRIKSKIVHSKINKSNILKPKAKKIKINFGNNQNTKQNIILTKTSKENTSSYNQSSSIKNSSIDNGSNKKYSQFPKRRVIKNNLKQNKKCKKLNIIKEINNVKDKPQINQYIYTHSAFTDNKLQSIENAKFFQRNNELRNTEKNRSFINKEKMEINKLSPNTMKPFLLKRLSVKEKRIYNSKNLSENNINNTYKTNKKYFHNPNKYVSETNLNYDINNSPDDFKKKNNDSRIHIDVSLKKHFSKKPQNKEESKKEEEDTFKYDENKTIILTKDDKNIYGERSMKGYKKIKLLGKGGYGLVWSCKKNNEDYEYAVKQTSKKMSLQHNLDDVLHIAKNEISILITLNEGEECNLIPKIFDFYEDHNDIWFSFEKGGISLSSLTFNIKGIFEKGERLYQIQKGEFLLLLFKNIRQFKYLLKKIIEGILFINDKGIIHSDIKPENILIQYSNYNNNFEITDIKIIDYGSAFYDTNPSPLISNTPEYLCPEITMNNKEFIKELNDEKYVNAIDIWSVGITFLELCLCCPIWMNFKTKVLINGKYKHSTGYFGCKCRDGNKIFHKQLELNQNLNKVLKNSMIYMFDKEDQENFVNLLERMLTFDYTKRINAREALNHPFLNDIC